MNLIPSTSVPPDFEGPVREDTPPPEPEPELWTGPSLPVDPKESLRLETLQCKYRLNVMDAATY